MRAMRGGSVMILGYVRCSTADQVKDDRTSLQTQQNIIEGFARTRGVDKYGVQIYTDAGVSGAVKLAFRPAGGQLLADMKVGDTVIASKLDRMFRSAADALNMFELFKEKQVDLVLYDMGNEPVTGGIGKLIMTILAAVADMERIRIKERTAEGRKATRAKGRAIGKVPFGYRKVGEGRSATLEVNERELAAAARIKVLTHTASIAQISAQLASEGFLARSGKPYSTSVIHKFIVA